MALFTAIGTAIASAVTGFFTATAIASLVLRTAVGLGVSLLAQKLQGKPEAPTFSIQGKMNTGEDVPRSFILGQAATAGSLAYSNEWGTLNKTPNAYHVQVIALSDLPVDSLAEVFVNGELVTLIRDEPHPERGFPVLEYRDDEGNVHDYLWIKFYDGTQTVADPYLVDRFGNLKDRKYESTRVGVGIAYAICTARVEEKLFTGFPEYKFVLNGLKLYDPSKDSTVGGTGTQREDNPATWRVSHNPVVQARALFRGITFQGKWFYGLQNLPAARLPADACIKQIRKADVSNPSTGNEPIYRAGGEVQISAPVSDAVAELMTTCQGRISETGGFYKPHIGVYDEAVASFSDADIVSTEEQSFTPFFGLADTINGVIGKYPAPKEAWNLKAAPPIYRPDFEVEDGNRRLMTEITLTFVPYPAQVQRLLNAAIREARRARRTTLVLPPEFYGIEAGDVLLDTSERNGFVQKRFRVDGAADKANLDTMVDLTEIDPADYSFDQRTDYRVPVDGGIKAVTLTAQPMDGWKVSPSEIVDANGIGRRPAILVETTDDLDDVRNVRVWVRLASTKAVVFDSDQYAYSAPFAWKISEALLPATAYEVSGILLPFSGRPTLQSEWLPVTTPDIRITLDDLAAQIADSLNTLQGWINDDVIGQAGQTAEDLIAETQARIAAIQAQAEALAAEAQARAAAIQVQANALQAETDARVAAVQQQATNLAAEAQTRAQAVQAQATALSSEQDERVAGAIEAAARYRAFSATLDELTTAIAAIDYSAFTRVEQVRTTLTASVGTAVASFNEQITAATAANAAVVQRVTTLETKTDGLNAKIVSVDTARASDYEALSQRMSLLSTGTDNQFDPTKLWPFDVTVEGWSGNGAPTVTVGYLRPADHGSDPYVTSPVGLGVNSNISRQVRARIRRVGAPVWAGVVYWKTVGDLDWTEARGQAVPEPAFDLNGIGLVTGQMAWTGLIDQIRIDLSIVQSPTDYFLIDWIAIGSPSPGASRAELLTEQQARASGDAANALLISTLQTTLTGATGDLQALSAGVNVIRTDVANLEDGIEAQGEALTALQTTVAGKATIDAVSSLQTQIEAIGPAGVVSHGEAITAIRNALLPIAAEQLDQDFANFVGAQNGLQATAAASQVLTTRIEVGETSLDIVAKAVTKVQADLPGKASAEGLSALTSRVTANETSIVAQSSLITSVQAALDQKASASAVTTLQTTVAQQGTALTSQSGAITALQSDIAGKASSAAVSSLTTRVSDAEGVNTSQASAITGLTSGLAGKASTTALSTLDTKVTEQAGALSALSSSVTAVRADLDGKASAGALSSLSSTVSQQGGTIASQGDAITSLTNTVADKASASAVSALGTRMSAAEGVNASQATAITNLQTTVAGKANASALTSLGATVTEQGGTLSSHGSAITALQSDVAGKASASALSALTTRVTNTENVNTSQGNAITGLQSAVADKASASAVSDLQTFTNYLHGVAGDQASQLNSQASLITALRADVNGKASASAVSSLIATVNEQGGTLSAHTTSLNYLNTVLAGKADASALSSLSTKVTEQGNTLTSQGGALTSVQASLGGKANASDVNSALAGKTSVSTTNELIGYVGYVEGVVGSHGSAITSLQNEVAGKASASAVSSLSSTVSQQGGQISAQASSITNLNASVNGITANARLKFEVVSGPSGYARIGGMASSSSNGQTSAAGFYIDVPNDTSQPSQFIVDANRFAVLDGTNKTGLFAVEDGRTVITAAFIPVITTDRIIFGDGSVQTSALAQGAAVDYFDFASVDAVTMTNVFQGIGDIDVPITDKDAVEVKADVRCRATALVGGKAFLQIELRENNSPVKDTVIEFSETGMTKNAVLFYTRRTGSGVFNYKIVVKKSAAGEDFFIGRRVISAPVFKKSR